MAMGTRRGLYRGMHRTGIPVGPWPRDGEIAKVTENAQDISCRLMPMPGEVNSPEATWVETKMLLCHLYGERIYLPTTLLALHRRPFSIVIDYSAFPTVISFVFLWSYANI